MSLTYFYVVLLRLQCYQYYFIYIYQLFLQNRENLFDPKSLIFHIQQKGSIISFPKGGVFNILLKIEDQINLKLQASYGAAKKN